MRTKVKMARPELTLSRILEALGQELIDATDEEVMAAAKDLGMDSNMKASAAFAGLRYPATPQLSDFFDLDACRTLQYSTQQIEDAGQRASKPKTRKSRPPVFSAERKDSSDK